MSAELDRIRQTYRQYAGDVRRQARWDPAIPGNRAIVGERWRAIAELLSGYGILKLSGWRVLEIGCGSVGNLAPLEQLGLNPKDFTGIDLLDERVSLARTSHPDIGLAVANGAALPFPRETFDALVVFTVLSSVLDPAVSQSIAREAIRVLRPGGFILWYDMRVRNPWNPNVMGIGRRKLAQLFPGLALNLRSVTVVPPLVRYLRSAGGSVYPLLSRVPVLRTHWAAVLRKGWSRPDSP